MRLFATHSSLVSRPSPSVSASVLLSESESLFDFTEAQLLAVTDATSDVERSKNVGGFAFGCKIRGVEIWMLGSGEAMSVLQRATSNAGQATQRKAAI